MNSIQSWLLTIILSGGGGAAVALAIARAFGSKWLESRFAARLQSMRHEQAREIEHLRATISGQLDRTTKLNQREFDVLPEAWSLVCDAHVEASRLLSRLRTFPDFSKMHGPSLDDFLASTELAEWEKAEIKDLKPEEQQSYYADKLYHHELWRAKVAAQKAEFFLTRSGIFLSTEVLDRLASFVKSTWDAVTTWEVVKELMESREKYPLERHDDAYREKSDEALAELSKFIRGRFRAG